MAGPIAVVNPYSAAAIAEGKDANFNTVSPAAILLVTLSFTVLPLCLPTLIWHVKNRNLAASTMVAYILMDNLFNIANAFLWPTDNYTSWWYGEGYCDIQVKLEVARVVGLPGSLACIMKTLADALDTDRTRLTPSVRERRVALAREILLCFVLPLCIAAAHFVVQPDRYYIFAVAGCVPSYSDSWLSLFLAFIWPPIMVLLASYFAVLVIIRLRRYRRDFASILARGSSGLNRSRFLRLFGNAGLLVLVFLPVQIFAFSRNVSAGPITTWDWNATHADASRWQVIRMEPMFGAVYTDRWVCPASGLAVFLCFGLGADAVGLYCDFLRFFGLDIIFPCLRRDGARDGDSYARPVLGTYGSGSSSSTSTLITRAKSAFKKGFATHLLSFAPSSTGNSRDLSISQHSLASHHDNNTANTTSLPLGNAENAGKQRRGNLFLLSSTASTIRAVGRFASRLFEKGRRGLRRDSGDGSAAVRGATTTATRASAPGCYDLPEVLPAGTTSGGGAGAGAGTVGPTTARMAPKQTWQSAEEAIRKMRREIEYEERVVGALV